MTAAHLDELLVVAEDNSGKIIGSISQRDIVLAYNRRLIRMVRQDDEGDDEADSPAITLHKLIDDEAIVMPLQPGSKQQIMEQLIAPLAGVEHHCRPDHLLEQLMERENKMTTAIMPHIALPHAQNLGDSGLRKAHLVVGICPEGTDFGSMDGEPTHVFFLICSLDQRSHLKTMADLARLIRNPGTVEALRKAASAEDVMRIMQSLSG